MSKSDKNKQFPEIRHENGDDDAFEHVRGVEGAIGFKVQELDVPPWRPPQPPKPIRPKQPF
jgi:hypothetical protein